VDTPGYWQKEVQRLFISDDQQGARPDGATGRWQRHLLISREAMFDDAQTFHGPVSHTSIGITAAVSHADWWVLLRALWPTAAAATTVTAEHCTLQR